MDMMIKNARLRKRGKELFSIAIKDGKIAEVTPGAPSHGATKEIDAEGGLVTESFVNGHLHFYKVYTLIEDRKSVV